MQLDHTIRQSCSSIGSNSVAIAVACPQKNFSKSASYQLSSRSPDLVADMRGACRSKVTTDSREAGTALTILLGLCHFWTKLTFIIRLTTHVKTATHAVHYLHFYIWPAPETRMLSSDGNAASSLITTLVWYLFHCFFFILAVYFFELVNFMCKKYYDQNWIIMIIIIPSL